MEAKKSPMQLIGLRRDIDNLVDALSNIKHDDVYITISYKLHEENSVINLKGSTKKDKAQLLLDCINNNLIVLPFDTSAIQAKLVHISMRKFYIKIEFSPKLFQLVAMRLTKKTSPASIAYLLDRTLPPLDLDKPSKDAPPIYLRGIQSPSASSVKFIQPNEADEQSSVKGFDKESQRTRRDLFADGGTAEKLLPEESDDVDEDDNCKCCRIN